MMIASFLASGPEAFTPVSNALQQAYDRLFTDGLILYQAESIIRNTFRQPYENLHISKKREFLRNGTRYGNAKGHATTMGNDALNEAALQQGLKAFDI